MIPHLPTYSCGLAVDSTVDSKDNKGIGFVKHAPSNKVIALPFTDEQLRSMGELSLEKNWCPESYLWSCDTGVSQNLWALLKNQHNIEAPSHGEVFEYADAANHFPTPKKSEPDAAAARWSEEAPGANEPGV